jgi:hypothetical protein
MQAINEMASKLEVLGKQIKLSKNGRRKPKYIKEY